MADPIPDFVEMDNTLPGDYVSRFAAYLERLYDIYMNEVAKGNLRFKGLGVSCQYRPETHGKHYAFWHMMQEGGMGSTNEDDRTIDFERCRRVRWIGWTIRNADRNPRIRVFPQAKRHGNQPWALWVAEVDYLVILWERNSYYLLKTAYVIGRKGKRKKLQQEWDAYQKKAGVAASDDPESSVHSW